MKGFIKTWWHCLWRIFKGCRMACITKWENNSPIGREWKCSCQLTEEYKEHLK